MVERVGSNEDVLKFLSKPKNKKVLEYLKRGDLKAVEISKIVGYILILSQKSKK